MRHLITRNYALGASATLALVALTPLSARAEPDCDPQQAMKPGDLFWPVWERNWDENNNPIPEVERTGVWNTLGEFQTGSPAWLHSGVDFNAAWSSKEPNAGDFALVVRNSHIWTANQFTDGCTDAYACRIVTKTTNERYYHYYAHLNISPTAQSDYHVEIRSKLEAAMANTEEDQVAPEAFVIEGTLLAGIGQYHSGFSHLHLSIFDACENYDSLDPLDYVRHPYEDTHDPIIDQVDFVEGNAPIVLSDHCDQLDVSELDIVAKMRDVWDDSGTWPGNEHLGVQRARLMVRNLTDETNVIERGWYRHDALTFKCRGPNKGLACLTGPDPESENTAEITLTDFMAEMGIDFPNQQPVGPAMSTNFLPALFRQAAPYASESQDHAGLNVEYYHQMTSEWGLHGEGGLGGTIDTSQGGDIPKGWYQFSVEAFDREGNGAVEHLFARVRRGSSAGPPFNQAPGNLVIRDHAKDIGAIPSNLGGQIHYRSPSIRVGGEDDPTPNPHDQNFWETHPVTVEQGLSYKVWVRVENMGCDDVSGPIYVTAATAEPALISEGWAFVDPQNEYKTLSGLDKDDAAVVEFDWVPQESGHVCLIAAAHAQDDPGDVPFDNGFKFDDFEEPTRSAVPGDSNLGQHNVTVVGQSFQLGNPFDEPIDLGIEFACNDFPIHLEDAGAELIVDYDATLEAAWDDVPGTTLVASGSQLFVEFHKCRVELPRATLSALTLHEATLDLWMPTEILGAFDVDLTGIVNGEAHGGMSYRIEH